MAANTLKLTVRAHELATLLDRIPDSVTTLSLDCFDTLLWRNVHAPRDVFAGIDATGGAVGPRLWSENDARRMRHVRQKCFEVGLHDIYRRFLLNGSDEAIDAAVEHELGLEASHLFPFTPVVELMRAAKARGLFIIIVSDMYLTEAQLRDLLRRCAGDEIVGMIDHVFMSSAYGTSKAAKLFSHVLAHIGAAPDQVLHIGDNKDADYHGASRAGIHAVHLEQFDTESVKRLRLESVAGVMLDPATRVTVPAWQPHRPQVSMRTQTAPAYTLGHDVMGPAMHAMALWVKQDIDAMSAKLGKPVRPLFLMRDGWLPFRVFDAIYPDAGATPVEISRVIAVRASLRTREDIDAFVEEYLHTLPHKSVAKQIGLYDQEIDKLLKKRPGQPVDDKAFRRALKDPELQRKVLTRAKAMRDRLKAHLKLAGVNDGDAVMFVDVGYKGTVQNLLTPVLQDEMGLTIAGRYIFMREVTVSGYDKKGLIGTDLYDYRALQSLVISVGIIEQMCNIGQGSTVDYTADGAPIREESGIKSQQNALRDVIQNAALDFARNAFANMHRRPSSDDIASRRRMAGAVLARLMFLPLPSEVAVFEQFDHDVNLGTNVRLDMVDQDAATEGLRRRGLAYVVESPRMFMPGEIAQHGVAMSMTYFANSRYALDFRNSDFAIGGFDVPVLLLTATDQTVVQMAAHPTHDGFYRIVVPVGTQAPTVAIQLGTVCETVQIERAVWEPIEDFDANHAAPVDRSFTTQLMTDGMTSIAEDIYSCGQTGVVVAQPPKMKDDEAHVLSLIFRPLRLRGTGTALKAVA